MRARRISFRPASAYTRRPSTRHSRLTQRMTRPSTPSSATSRLVPAPSNRYGMPRSWQARTSGAGAAVATKYSAGPPMLNEVRRASGWSRRRPGSRASQPRLAGVRQLVAKPPDVPSAHDQDQVTGTDQRLQPATGGLQIGSEARSGDPLRQLGRAHPGRRLLPGGVDLDH